MTRSWPSFQASLLGLALLAGCSQTSYVDRNVGRQDAGALNPFDRVVEYHLDLGFVASRPTCIAVGSVGVAVGAPQGQHIVDTVHLALLTRVPAVLPDVTIVEIDPDPASAIFESTIRGCPYVLLIEIIAQDDAYLLVWSRKRIGIRARLIRVDDLEEVWSAQHTASRSEGDIPLSPFGAIVSAFRAKDFAEDNDVIPSMIDDAVRRILAAFPMATGSRGGVT